MKKGSIEFLKQFLSGREGLSVAESGNAHMVIKLPVAFFATEESMPDSESVCPRCGSEANYKYGKSWTGKQRFRCLMCGMQFTGRPKNPPEERPNCPKCGSEMHVYKKEKKTIRFRCRMYPECKTFVKINTENEGK